MSSALIFKVTKRKRACFGRLRLDCEFLFVCGSPCCPAVLPFAMPKFRSSLPAPARIFVPGCALAAGLLVMAPSAWAAPATTPTISSAAILRVGNSATYPFPARSTYKIESGTLNVLCGTREGTLSVKALREGAVRLRIETPGQNPRVITLQLAQADDKAAPTTSGFGSQTLLPAVPVAATKPTTIAISIPPIALDKLAVTNRVSSQVIDRATFGGGVPQRAPLAGGAGAGTPAVSATPPINLGPIPAAGSMQTAGTPAGGVPLSPAPGSAANSPFQLFPPDYNNGNGAAIPNGAPLSIPAAGSPPLPQAPVTSNNPLPRPNLPASATPPVNATQPATSASQMMPRLPSPPATNSPATNATATNSMAPDTIINPTLPPSMQFGQPGAGANGVSISPSLPAPATGVNPNVNYKTTPSLPASYNQLKATQSVEVTQGEARLLKFQNNILAVFFSDPAVMDARAINARTIAVTGTGGGQSTLAVFTERYPGDAVGFPSIYRVSTRNRGGLPAATPDAASVEAALTMALGDPRIRVSVVKLPEGTLAARLTGIVRDSAEVQGAITTAAFFVPRVLPSVYADVNAPSIDAVLSGVAAQAPEGQLQDNLRRITGNSSIELIAMPGSLVLKAEAESQEDAQSLLQLLPTLNQPVIPFVTIRGGGRMESSNIPVLQGEDLQLTQKLQAVTNVRTVYAVRASGNSVAIYGSVQNRGEYETVKRYGLIVAQSAAPVATQGSGQGGSVFRPQGAEPALLAYDPAAGYQRQLGVQMFVRILDPTEATIRNVTIETNIVEITRNNLKNLGAEYGSATLLSENIAAGTSTPVLDGNGNPIIDVNGRPLTNTTPTTTTRTIDPAFSAGTQILGNGFAGFGGFGAINPFRARINAIATKNNARVLASPNIRATEGTVAQITIGGERPVPTASASFGSNAQSIEFRRFGVILTMRPTVSDDNTIILQIRADVTQPDQTFAINVNGAIIPGESVRSIDTTITVRPGDVVVMGGLLSNDKRQQTSKVPILGDIPIIGSLFRSKRFENNETELAIFMTPRIDALPATQHTNAILERIPSFPPLPGRQESGSSVFSQSQVRQTN